MSNYSGGALGGAPVWQILAMGLADIEVHDIAQFCRPFNILVNGSSADVALENRLLNRADLVVIDVSTINRDRESVLDVVHALELPVLCLLPQIDRVDPEKLSRLCINDFLFRPYSAEELVCRARVWLARRRTAIGSLMLEKRSGERRRSDYGNRGSARSHAPESLILDPRTKCASVNGKQISLTRREYALLGLLVAEAGQVVSTEAIVREIWGESQRAGASDVQQYVHLLRKKIESDPHDPHWIKTVKGFGYKLELPG